MTETLVRFLVEKTLCLRCVAKICLASVGWMVNMAGFHVFNHVLFVVTSVEKAKTTFGIVV
jgi:hypothetical protein